MGSTLDSLIHQSFFRWGRFVYRHRMIMALSPIVLTLFLSAGFIYLEQQTTKDPEYFFSPFNAPWRRERAILAEHWPLNERSFWPGKSYDYEGYIDIIAAGKMNEEKGRPNMLSLRYLDELERINQYIIHNLTVPVEYKEKLYQIGFTDLCMSYDRKCYLNDHITMLMPKNRWGDFKGDVAEFANDIIFTEVKITYPIGWRGTEPIYFGAFIGGPHLVDEDGHFDYARAIRLTFNTREENVGNVSHIWRREVARYLSDKENPPSGIVGAFDRM
ncbi:hypothetical protein AB6A40_006541 [Gnathostoma spinigerum]|uniref:Uncharacterized protein n=1 Tax=Gnathostoma spinigerum TaxID=75299 RepID=A0ABD6ET22_9BILA